MPELLVELLSEEIPARMQVRAAQDLHDLVTKGLAGAGLAVGGAQSFATPRRLALVVRGLPDRSPDQDVERKGPRADAPPAAIDGFLRSTGLKREQLEERDMGKAGRVLFAVQQVKGRAVAEAAADVLQAAIVALPWPKSMRWADNAFRWVRPLHRIFAVIDGKALPLRISLKDGGVALVAGDETEGHRFLAPGPVAVSSFDDYVAKLRSAHVVLDTAERKKIILQEGERAAARYQVRLRRDDGLLDEVAGLVEWPVPLVGSIDAAFMDLPPEVLTTTMRTHQRYFALETNDGKLAPRFLLVANMAARDGGKDIVKGNERVLRARLADAKFFWDLDRKVRLESRVPALNEIVFQAKLGTISDKAARISKLATVFAGRVGADAVLAGRAALLAKADLRTAVVGEFPELQGVMGRYYAANDREAPEVALAIQEHYLPRGSEDLCPVAPISVVVALADKIDTLVAFWAIGEKPTGSKDPYALRRATLGVIRIILDNQLQFPLLPAFEAARQLVEATLIRVEEERLGTEAEETEDSTIGLNEELLRFFADRLKVHLKDRGVRHDFISAVFAKTGEDNLCRLLDRVFALGNFLLKPTGNDLLVAYRRAANILRIEEVRDATTYRDAPDPSLFSTEEEWQLARALASYGQGVRIALRDHLFEGAMQQLSQLRNPVDAFFDGVTVNADDPALRRNRLRLLSQITATLEQVADFSKIEG